MNLKNFDQISDINSFFGTQQATDNIFVFGIDIALLTLMSIILGFIFVRSAYSLSNRKRLAVMFPVLAITTMMVISIIQSSLALSLGLVGALSIIRFRSAIKEPEELVYIFLIVALGLGFGAQQRVITILFFLAITILLVARLVGQKRFSFMSSKDHVLHYLDISQPKNKQSQSIDTKKIVDILDKNCQKIGLKRFDSTKDSNQLLFEVTIDSVADLEKIVELLRKELPTANLTVTQHEPLFG